MIKKETLFPEKIQEAAFLEFRSIVRSGSIDNHDGLPQAIGAVAVGNDAPPWMAARKIPEFIGIPT